TIRPRHVWEPPESLWCKRIHFAFVAPIFKKFHFLSKQSLTRGGSHGSASMLHRESADDRQDAGRTALAGGSTTGGSTDQPHRSLPTAPAGAYRRGSGTGGSVAWASDQSVRTGAAVAGPVLSR